MFNLQTPLLSLLPLIHYLSQFLLQLIFHSL